MMRTDAFSPADAAAGRDAAAKVARLCWRKVVIVMWKVAQSRLIRNNGQLFIYLFTIIYIEIVREVRRQTIKATAKLQKMKLTVNGASHATCSNIT